MLMGARRRIDAETKPKAAVEDAFEKGEVEDITKQEQEEARRAKLRKEVFALQVDRASDIFIEDLVIFVMFFIIFTFISFSNRRFNADFYYYNNQMSATFETTSFLNISSHGGMWDYLEKEAIPLVTENRWYNGQPISEFGTGYVLLLSKCLGSFRLRQVRGAKESASLGGLVPGGAEGILSEFKYSYSSSDPDSETMTRGGIQYEFTDLDGVSTQGSYGTYPASGFVTNFNPSIVDGDLIRSQVKQMRHAGWTDDQTRAVLLEINLYNPSEDLYMTIVILFEMPLVGGVKANSIQTQVLRLNRYDTPFDYAILAFELVLTVLMIDFFRTLVSRIQLEGREVFKQTWTWFDCVNLTSLWLVMVLRISWLVYWMNTNVNSEEYVDLSLIGSIYYWDNAINSLNSLLINLRSFKFLALWDRMQIFKDCIKISVPKIAMYWLNLFIVMFAFASAGFVAFGKHLGGYRDMGFALITQFKMASGQFDFAVALHCSKNLCIDRVLLAGTEGSRPISWSLLFDRLCHIGVLLSYLHVYGYQLSHL